MSVVKIIFVEISGIEKVIENVEVGDNMMQIV